MQHAVTRPSTLSTQAIIIGCGAIALTLLSQLRVNLPFTPVPITAQSLGVILCGLLLGSKRGTLAVAAYLVAGALGAPVFAGFTSLPALWGPTSGYLLGFIPAAWLAGFLKETGWVKGFSSGFVVSLVASIPIFILGTPVLALFVGLNNVMMMGVVPFLIGDVVKSVIAAGIVSSILRR